MDESTLTLVVFIKDLMIIIGLGLLIMTLAFVLVMIIRLQGSIASIKRTVGNLEEASGVMLDSTKEISRTLVFFKAINLLVEKVKQRFSKEDE